MIQVGRKAPDFTAQAYVRGDFATVRRDDFRGRWLVLFFYPLDFTFVCPTELRAFAHKEAAFRQRGADVAAISVDSIYTHQAWLERDLPEVRFPVLSDVTRTITRDYGVLLEDEGVAMRATFVIDPESVVRYLVVSSQDVGRSVEDVLRVLDALHTGHLCPAEWRPGQPTLGAGK